MEPELSPDQNRRLESMVRFGAIAEVDHGNALCRAVSGGITTDWLPWIERRAGDVRDWCPLSVGEQCVILSPSGETGAGAILTGLYQDSRPAPESESAVSARHWDDGATVRYDQAAHEYLLDVPADGKITFRIGGTSLVMTTNGATLTADAVTVVAPPITLQGNVLILGSLTGQPGAGMGGGNAVFHGRIDADVDVTGAGVSLKDHVHGGVQPGGGNTGAPAGGG
ncbi:MAG: phage baseplate assembly protein V [Azoarcus sp.]|nr:phage baseplate assembly protein V [Azoarcus sp.]